MRLSTLLATLIPVAILTACTTTPPVDCEYKNPKKPVVSGSCNEGSTTPLLRKPKRPVIHDRPGKLVMPIKKKVIPREPVGSEHDENKGGEKGQSTGGYTHGKI